VRRIRDLVAAVEADDSACHSLRFDPAALARSLDLNSGHLAALHSAERFFVSESPIVERPAETPIKATAEHALVRRSIAISSPAPELTATADTGTLHTGPTHGTYTISSSAAFPDAVTPTPGPQRPPGPTQAAGSPSPVTPPPVQPGPAQQRPVAPGYPVPGQLPPPGWVVPPAPGRVPPPAVLQPPSSRQPPSVPRPAGECPARPPEVTSPLPGQAANHHACCHAATVAIVGQASATAITAQVALTAIRRQRRPPGGRYARGATP
jgi:hypothetical protein